MQTSSWGDAYLFWEAVPVDSGHPRKGSWKRVQLGLGGHLPDKGDSNVICHDQSTLNHPNFCLLFLMLCVTVPSLWPSLDLQPMI